MFRDKVVIVTGASSGLGATLATEFATAGAKVALFSPEAEKQAEVARQCEAVGGRALSVVGDVTRAQDCDNLVQKTLGSFGTLDYLVANAGISMWAPFADVDDLEVFRKLVEVNYLGAVNCVHFALPHLIASKGMVVAITSIQGKIGVPLHTGYVASKHALQGFCESLRMELAGTGVDILTVLPHWLRGTDLRKNAFGKDGRALGTSSRRHSKESISLEEAARKIMQATHKRKRSLVIPWKLRLLLALNLFAPGLAEALITGAVKHQDD
jgi:NAD(P)-dependent dehydrogenase (short-subunit alcohol dehydrogenase family)